MTLYIRLIHEATPVDRPQLGYIGK